MVVEFTVVFCVQDSLKTDGESMDKPKGLWGGLVRKLSVRNPAHFSTSLLRINKWFHAGRGSERILLVELISKVPNNILCKMGGEIQNNVSLVELI